MNKIEKFQEFNQDLIDAVKDHFQELIDDSNIEDINGISGDDWFDNSDINGIFYTISPRDNSRNGGKRTWVEIYLWCGRDYIDQFEKMESSLDIFKSAMENRGYSVKFNYTVESFIQKVIKKGYVETFEITINDFN